MTLPLCTSLPEESLTTTAQEAQWALDTCWDMMMKKKNSVLRIHIYSIILNITKFLAVQLWNSTSLNTF
jgi:hypothetical protein